MSEESNVVDLRCVTRLPLDPDRVLSKAIGKLSEVVIVGFTKDGEEYFASSEPGGADALLHLMRAQKKLLDLADNEG